MSSDFTRQFIANNNISFIGMRDTAMSLLPNDKAVLDKLYNDLNRGTNILDDETHLNMYLRCFGKMHKAKLDTAFSCLPDPLSIFSEEIEIYDWGCGQGTASICLLDFLRSINSSHNITSINLIEPSIPATERAKEVISCFDKHITVNVINKNFDDLIIQDFDQSNHTKLHLFSNILDVDTFDIAQFIHLFQSSFSGTNYFICVGPYYSNNKRVDEFIAATDPDSMFATYNRERGSWHNEWTISLRVFFKEIIRIEDVQDIRKRIDELHKQDQFFAGYILDSVTEEYTKSDIEQETDELLKSLCVFDVKSNTSLENIKDCDSKFAVLANIVSRGLPTIAPIAVESIFADAFDISVRSDENSKICYKSKHRISKTDIRETLHIIDPRFNISHYNGDMLESQFERDFIDNYLANSDFQYLIQLLEPQRPLSSIVNLPDRRFSRDQRVDFAIEIPYGDHKTGFIFELDGAPYHSSLFHKLRDKERDTMSSKCGYQTFRLENLDDFSFIQNWAQEASLNNFLSTIKRNSKKRIEGSWKDSLQIVLSPIAIARVERMLLQALLSGILDINKAEWNVLVVERDVPCAAIAIACFKESLKTISAMEGSKFKLPDIRLSIVSTLEFADSKLHIGKPVVTFIPEKEFDLCIDISILLRDNIDTLPLQAKANSIYIIRSSHYKKKERTICSAENIIYPPFVRKDTSGSFVAIKEREELLTYFLQNIFRKPSFRQGQLPILSRSLSDKTTIGLLPTGGGKSLTYQLSSMLQPGVTIVVDPLVSLMVDQIRGLHELRIDASDCVNGNMDGPTKAKKLNMLQNGNLMFMLLSPERYMMKNFRNALTSMTEKNDIHFAYGVIDEVHCVSEWGHDFRPSYLHLGRNMMKFMRTKSDRPLSIIGLTATASFDVLADVERELTLGGNLSIDSETIVRSEDDTRPELTYRIIDIDSDFEPLRDPLDSYLLTAKSELELKDIVAESKKRAMYDLIHEIPAKIEELNTADKNKGCQLPDYSASHFYPADERGKYNHAGIIFCPHIHGTCGVNDTVPGNGISSGLMAKCGTALKIGTFVGGDKPSGDMKRFNDNDLNLMVATKAFGMGIDKPNVRFTININHPSSIESFVQEAGRAGRDKKHAIAYVLYDSTEYIHLTADKIQLLRGKAYSALGVDPSWLESDSYINKFILHSDFITLCNEHNDSQEVTDKLLSICKEHSLFENIDKNIPLWFHNNSFRGSYKERVILLEFTDRLLNAKATYLHQIQETLVEETGNRDILLKPDIKKNAVKILSKENSKHQYGYIFLENLFPTLKFVDFDRPTCHQICTTLIKILSEYEDHTIHGLLKPIDGLDYTEEGIYSAMEKADADGYTYVTVSWENSVQQNFDQFVDSIKSEIDRITHDKKWNPLKRDLNLRKVGSFEELIEQISDKSEDRNWLRSLTTEPEIFSGLKKQFCRKRDKDDTDKAIYRLCCIGIVEDVTIDYSSNSYELKIINRTDDEFKQYMFDFFRKYYSIEQANKKVEQIEHQKGRNYLDKCLGYLTAFVYDNLEKKRLQAIEDIRIACEDNSIKDRNKDSITYREIENKDKRLKEFIHLYFNSKYARDNYMVGDDMYSLSRDTCEDGGDSFNIVQKYIDVISKDSSGSEVDNMKHLYGATLLCLRAHTDNAALQLLRTYCIAFLGAGTNETLRANARNGYFNGFMTMYEYEGANMWKNVDTFNNLLSLNAKDDYIKEHLVKNGKESLILFIHEKKFNDFTIRYTERDTNITDKYPSNEIYNLLQ